MSLRQIVFAVTGIVIAAAACASANGKSASRSPCPLLERDSVFVPGSSPVYRDCAVDRTARLLTTDVRPDFRPTTPRSTCYSVDLEFVVDPTGKPEAGTAHIVRANDQEFGASVLASLTSWKFDPAMRGGVPVRQIVTEHKSVSTVVVAVRQGSGPPSGPPSQRPPSC
jgi:hypothetical protein